MPPLVNYPNVLKVDQLWTIGTDITAMTRSHFLYTGGPPTVPDCDAIAALFLAAVPAQMQPYYSPQVICTGFEVTDLTSATSASGAASGSIVGSRLGGALPAEVAFLLNFKIARRYRGGKPRMYLPYGTDTDVATSQTWLPTSVTNFTASWATGMVPSVVGHTVGGTTIGAQVSISYYSGFLTTGPDSLGRFHYPPKPRSVAIAPDVVSAYIGSAKFGSQRRRNQR